MSFLRNTYIAKMLGISNTTVANWIKDAGAGNNALNLATIGKKKLIINSEYNLNILRKLLEKGRKHNPTLNQVNVVKAKKRTIRGF